jgi:hypothetical protein
MFTYPCIANQLATERQREMLPQAHQHRIIRQLPDLARASGAQSAPTGE